MWQPCDRHRHESAGTKDILGILQGVQNTPCDRYQNENDRNIAVVGTQLPMRATTMRHHITAGYIC